MEVWHRVLQQKVSFFDWERLAPCTKCLLKAEWRSNGAERVMYGALVNLKASCQGLIHHFSFSYFTPSKCIYNLRLPRMAGSAHLQTSSWCGTRVLHYSGTWVMFYTGLLVVSPVHLFSVHLFFFHPLLQFNLECTFMQVCGFFLSSKFHLEDALYLLLPCGRWCSWNLFLPYFLFCLKHSHAYWYCLFHLSHHCLSLWQIVTYHSNFSV